MRGLRTRLLDKVSVVMPVFNGEAHVSEAIVSVLEQTHDNLELIIVNDGSTDNTGSILDSYKRRDERVTIVTLLGASGGPAVPRNVGMSLCTGRYLAFIDHDDIWHRKKLELQIKMLVGLKIQFISSDRLDIKERSDFLDFPELNLGTPSYIEVTQPQLLADNLINTSSVVVERCIIGDVTFRKGEKYVAVEDYIMWVELHKIISVSIKLKAPLVGYRLRGGSISRNKFRMLRRRWCALEVLVGSSTSVKVRFIILYIFNYIRRRIVSASVTS